MMPTRPFAEPRQRRVVAFVVEAEPVDDGAVRCRAEDAWARITALRARRQRADFDEAEPRIEQRARNTRVLVEARCHADRIWEVEPEHTLHQPLVVRTQRARIKPELEPLDGKLVRPFGIEREQQALPKSEERVHASLPKGERWIWRGSTCRPSASSSIGAAQNTALSGSGA